MKKRIRLSEEEIFFLLLRKLCKEEKDFVNGEIKLIYGLVKENNNLPYYKPEIIKYEVSLFEYSIVIRFYLKEEYKNNIMFEAIWDRSLGKYTKIDELFCVLAKEVLINGEVL